MKNLLHNKFVCLLPLSFYLSLVKIFSKTETLCDNKPLLIVF